MPKFENINSPLERLSLEKQIRLAVAQAVEPLVLSGSWRTYLGPQQEQLTTELCTVIGTEHVGLCSSGSAALEMILRACRFEPGSEVMLSTYDYPGNFTAIENSGHRPVLVDVAPSSWNVSLDSLMDTWSPSCRVLVVSHLHGQLQDMPTLQAWCREHNMLLIQDACQALGASLSGQRLGASSDATILSFGGSKTLSAGRGGAWCTSDTALAQHARLAAGVGSGAYEMSELQAAMILAQLPFLQRITSQSRHYFGDLAQQLSVIPDMHAPWLDQLESTAFYQAGWVTSPMDFQNQLEVLTNEKLRELFKQAGPGFDGFHRRSERRCRKARSLSSAADIASRTMTLHHRHAIMEC